MPRATPPAQLRGSVASRDRLPLSAVLESTPSAAIVDAERGDSRRGQLIDRSAERLALQGVLDAVRAGTSGTLVLCGEPGIGKSALLRCAIESAADLLVLEMAAVESEAAMGFAAVHQLLRPLLPAIDRLPEPQQTALQVAFGMVGGPQPDPFLVGLAVLTLLSDAAEARPVLCVIDDAQWLDDESAHVIGIVARRLLADRVGMLIAVRDTTDHDPRLQGLPTLRLSGLPEQHALELLATMVSPPPAPEVAHHIVVETCGNPLALLEVARDLTAEQSAGHAPLPEPLSLGPQLEAPFVRRTRELPPETQRLLLLAAADGQGRSDRLWQAATTLGVPESASLSAESAGLAVFWPEVRFAHPLVRSAVYHAATTGQRRQVHRALAAACDPDHDADARAWHLAAAASGPDERVAADLEASAERVRNRGGSAAVARLLAGAALLTPDRSRRAERQLRAAEAELLAGAVDRAEALLARTTTDLNHPLARARATWLDGRIRLARREPSEAAATLLRAAQELEALDPSAGRDALFAALQAALAAGWGAGSAVLEDIARTAESLVAGTPGEAPADLLLYGYAVRVTQGHVAAVPVLRRALDRLATDDPESSVGIDRLMPAIAAAAELWDDAALDLLTERWVQLARASGAVTTLQVALACRIIFADVPGGRLAAARTASAESRELAAVTGGPRTEATPGHDALLQLVFAGRETEARATAAALSRAARDRHAFGEVALIAYALGVLELSLGNYEAAVGWLDQVCEDDGALAAFALPDLVEAAVRAGRRDTAQQALGRLGERARAAGTQLALGLLARAQAVLADPDEAGQAYEEAVTRLGRSRSAPQLARAHLLYGEWLRRQRRRREARHQLRTAHEMFDAMGLEIFARRAAAELRATGEHARRREVGAVEELTPQEAQIAELVSQGEANRDIAARLFISPNTVEYHLRKVFRKLDVSSRTQLARRVLDESIRLA
jgi:DNA-binding CsgD family transcriptional regulator